MQSQYPNVEIINRIEGKIHYVGFCNCPTEKALLQQLDVMATIFNDSAVPVNTIDDFTNVSPGREFMDRVKILGEQIFSKNRGPSAILGVTGLKKVLLRTYLYFSKDNIQICETKSEAIDYIFAELAK